MNQTQKNHLRARIRKIAEDARDELKTPDKIGQFEMVELGIKERALAWPGVADLRQAVLNHVQFGGGYNSPSLMEQVWDEDWTAWKEQVENMHAESKEQVSKVKKQINRLADEAVDEVFLGDAKDALTNLQKFADSIRLVVEAHNASVS